MNNEKNTEHSLKSFAKKERKKERGKCHGLLNPNPTPEYIPNQFSIELQKKNK